MLNHCSLEEKKTIYTAYIRQMRADKIAENKKKFDFYGYTDEDDYNFLAPPEGYDWKPEPTCENGDFHGYTAWSKNYAAMLESFPSVVVPYDAMAGNYYKILHKYRKLRWNPEIPFTQFEQAIERYDIDHGIGQVHHFCGDANIGLRLGWGGILDKVKHYAAINGGKDAETDEFYESEIRVVEAIIAWIGRTVERIEELLQTQTDPVLRENLTEMLAANRHVQTQPPRNLREACQFLSWYNMAGRAYNREGAGGQLDQMLYPYYRADKANGLIDDEDAVFMIAGLLMSDTKYYQLGGPNDAGEDMINEVSWLILEAADRLDVTANLTIRVHNGLDRKFFHRAVELLFKHKNAWPRFSGDQALVSGFVKNGVTESQARKRIAVGCNWMATPGVEYCLNDSIKVNLAKIFEVAFDELMQQQEQTTEKLFSLYEKHLALCLETVFQSTDFHLRTSRYNSPELFLNLFCQGPIEKGTDASNHSVQYYTIGVDGAGIAVAADSFAALEQRVEQEQKLSWLQVKNAVRCNYSSPAAQRIQHILLHAEKFGQGKNLGMKWAVRIKELFVKLVVEGRSEEGVQFIPGFFSWSKTIRFGQTVGATPDGRKAGEAINHGANPMPGSVKNGEMTAISEAILAVQCERGNTVPFQMELDPGITAAEGGVEKVMALLDTHLRCGGTLINVNVLDKEKILAAHKDPSLYPDLVVRVTGFTAYFASLSPEFRQLVVDRIVSAQ